MEKLISRYFDYLKDITQVRFIEKTGYYAISYPLPDRYDDFTTIYLKNDGNNILITDGGNSIMELYMLGIKVMENDHRKKLLEQSLRKRNLMLNTETYEIFTKTDFENFNDVFNYFLRGISNIQDFYLTKKEISKRIFADEFKDYLDSFLKDNIISEKEVSLASKNNKKLTFNYKLTSQDSNKSKLIRLQSSSDDVYKNIYIWNELDDSEKQNSSFIVVINNDKITTQKYKDIQDMYDDKNIISVDWADKKSLLEYINAI